MSSFGLGVNGVIIDAQLWAVESVDCKFRFGSSARQNSALKSLAVSAPLWHGAAGSPKSSEVPKSTANLGLEIFREATNYHASCANPRITMNHV